MRLAAKLAMGAVLLCALLWPAGAARAGEGPGGVVSLRITVQEFDPAAPWRKKPERMILGNALVVREGLLLTTADLIRNATLIEVRKFGRYPNFRANAVLVDYQVDLALLEVPSEVFWAGLRPLNISPAPISSGRFEISRWRANGRFEQGSGEVVELRVATSRFGNLEFPQLRATTAMSGLGWGEVLTLNGEVIGLITDHDKQALQAVNSPLLRLFIAAAAREPYRGFAHRGFAWQQLNHPALRDFFGLERESPGVLIRRIYAGGTGSAQLRYGDILLQLGEHVIDPEGQIDHPSYGPILFTIAINESLDEIIEAVVLRGGERRILQLRRELFSPEVYRVHPYDFEQPIDFEIFGGLVLQELSLRYLRLWGKNWRHQAPSRIVMEYVLNSLREKDEDVEKVVFISRVFPDESNLGYDGVQNTIVRRFNGVKVVSLRDFRAAARKPENGFHVLELNPGAGRKTLIFNAAEMERANRRVRERYGVPPAAGAVAARGDAAARQ